MKKEKNEQSVNEREIKYAIPYEHLKDEGDFMKIYRVSVLDMMGFRINELFFKSLEKARNEYAKLLIQYRNNENIVERGEESYLSNPIVKVSYTTTNCIKQHMIELWYKTSYEYDEWDTNVESIQLEKIEVA